MLTDSVSVSASPPSGAYTLRKNSGQVVVRFNDNKIKDDADADVDMHVCMYVCMCV